MPKSLEDLLAMSNTALERHAGTLQPGTFVGPDPWILDDLDELRLRLEEAMWGDPSDAGLVRHIAHLRRCIQYREAVGLGENRDEAWARAFDQPLERIKRIQARAAEAAAKLRSE